jgi:hypothetical protein
MRSMLRLLAIVTLLFGLGLRSVEFHAHEGAAPHAGDCAVCRILHTPFVAPSPGATLLPLAPAAAERPAALPSDLAPQAPLRSGLHLRAPPVA